MSHTPRLTSGYVFKRYLNAKRLRERVGPPVPPGGFVLFTASNYPDPPETAEGLAVDKKTEFLTYLVPDFDVLDWEDYFSGFPVMTTFEPPTFTFNGIDMTIPNPDYLGLPYYNESAFYIVEGDPLNGRYNTTSGGTQFLQNMATTALGGAFEAQAAAMYFDPPISCFGAYLTDLGDFTGVFTLRLIASDDSFTDFVLSTGGEAGGKLTFWGFIDTDKTYKQITFYCSAGVTEGFGMDDVIFGPLSMVDVP